MTSTALDERFAAVTVSPRLTWTHPPPSAASGSGKLCVQVAPSTDAWSITHYGFRVHNAHFMHLSDVQGDFVLCTRVTTQPRQRYDQAGLMVQLSRSCWLKTSVEHNAEGGASQLGVVVTNAGYSDWSTQELPHAFDTVVLRVRREGSDYTVEACVPADSLAPRGACAAGCPISVSSGEPGSAVSEWSQLRICHLLEDPSPAGVAAEAHGAALAGLALPLSGVAAGLYACSPKPGEGFTAEFAHLTLLAGRLPGSRAD